MVENSGYVRKWTAPADSENSIKGVFGSLSSKLMKVVPSVRTGQAALWCHSGRNQTTKAYRLHKYTQELSSSKHCCHGRLTLKVVPEGSQMRSRVLDDDIHHPYIIIYCAVSSMKAETLHFCAWNPQSLVEHQTRRKCSINILSSKRQ